MSVKHKGVDRSGDSLELIIFTVDTITCGLKTTGVQEIIKELRITAVHNAPPYVKGVINLRGKIVTIIDMRVKFGKEAKEHPSMRIVIISLDDEAVGLLVDSVEDIVRAELSLVEEPPSNLNGLSGEFFDGIYKMDGGLVAIVDLRATLGLREFNTTF